MGAIVVLVISIRDATPSDAVGIGESHAEAWRIAYRDLFDDRFLRDAVEDRRLRWQDEWPDTAKDESFLLVSERDQEVVGFVHAGWSEDPASQEIFGFYVHPNHWGQGVAEPLMDMAMSRMADRSSGRVILWTHRGAARARRFYERTGWVLTGHTPR